MKRLIHFADALAAEAKAALTPAAKKALCEDAKLVIATFLTGPWAGLATAIVSDLEKTIVGA
jgi:hypothetical protein